VLIAAGSGITPILSIAASALARPQTRATLLYGNRQADSVMFADEVADLKDAYTDRLQLVHVLSREPQEVELFSGRLDAARLRRLLPATCDIAAVDHWWLCGPYGMVSDAQAVLAELAVPPQRVHRELFYVEDEPPEPQQHAEPGGPGAPGHGAGPASAVTVILDGRATTTSLGRDTPVLDGAQRVRPDLPFACKGGVCGTCRARVRAGQVTMRRNFALDPAEVAAGYVLTCQSVPVSDEVTIDYDA
jgi:ring-1,2-phenylacetyl-CoA epoxidase subunit PaaE